MPLASTPITSASESVDAPGDGHAPRVRRSRRVLALPVLVAGTLLALIIALGIGPVGIAPADTLIALRDAVLGRATEVANALVITEVRLPRSILALLAGAGLAIAGAAMQAYFRNPLADPGVTGVASGAAVGAVLVLVTGISVLGPWTLPVAAFAGAMAVLLVIQAVAMLSRDRGITTVLLLGIAMNAFCGALTGALIANADDSQTVRGAMFWLQGDLTAANWQDVALAAAPVAVGVLLLLGMSRELNALLLGEEIARSTGVDVARTRLGILVLTSVLVGSIIAVTGVIGFVGLVAPHIVRMLVGSDHRILLPASALLGALFLLAADTVARLAPAGTSWQTGVVTALVGSPLFFALVLRAKHGRRML
ncbi:FecCD family ABC transporter permease [Microbacterium sp. A93]|uniref:FecCD family ABC transporter permease n=1 Tax=unclassified Microbacterium TaxID=2609290 RepID=UPI003F42EB31